MPSYLNSPTKVALALSCAAALLTGAHAEHPAAADDPAPLGFFAKRKLRAQQVQAIVNAKQIGLALFSFSEDFGKFPCEQTVAGVKKAAKVKGEIKADSANDCFYQLFAAGQVDEPGLKIFSLDHPKDAKKPNAPVEKLENCFFSYISGRSFSDPISPLVVAPLVKGKKTFDPKVLGGEAVILFTDMSVKKLPIDKNGRVLIGGKDIFDPDQPFWKGKAPTIKWPE